MFLLSVYWKTSGSVCIVCHVPLFIWAAWQLLFLWRYLTMWNWHSFLGAVTMNVVLADMEFEYYLITQRVNFGEQFLYPYSA